MSDPLSEPFRERLAAIGGATLRGLHALEVAWRRLDPAQRDAIREMLEPLRDALGDARRAFDDTPTPEGFQPLCEDLAAGAEKVHEALSLIVDPGPPDTATVRVLGAMSVHCRAQEVLYPLRTVLPPLARYFVEEAFHDGLEQLDRTPPDGWSIGIHRAGDGSGDGRKQRGGFSLYVPEHTDGRTPLPLVVALHGGFGHGADFLWSWLREARGRGFLLLAPTSRGTTWSLNAPELDGRALRRMLAFVAERWRFDPERVLLTGLSDGATFSLLAGLADASPFTHLAPASGVLHPANFASGNLERARDRPIYLVHGARDWMFPVATAQMARDALQAAGARLVYREIEDLSHAYPREENDAILRWFDPRLALPAAQGSDG